MRADQVAAVLAAVLATGAPAPRLSHIADNTPVFARGDWPKTERNKDAFYVPSGTEDPLPAGIHLSKRVYKPLRRALDKGVPKDQNQRIDLAYALLLIGHELGRHKTGDHSNKAVQADRYAKDNYLRLAARTGIGPYERRALYRLMFPR